MAMKKIKPIEVEGVRGFVDENNVAHSLDFKGKGLNELGYALWGKLWKPMRPVPPQLACVYAAEMSDNTVKIGVSINPDERVQQVASAVYLEVQRVHHTDFAPRSFMYDIEKRCHAKFADRCVRGEFFNITFEEAVDELNSHADEIVAALAKADQRYSDEINYFFNEYLPAYEKTYTADEILPSIRRDGFYSVYKKELNRMECARTNLNGARAMFEAERMNLDYARRLLNEAITEKKFSTAEKLRELAVLTTEDTLRNDLIRQAAKILTD